MLPIAVYHLIICFFPSFASPSGCAVLCNANFNNDFISQALIHFVQYSKVVGRSELRCFWSKSQEGLRRLYPSAVVVDPIEAQKHRKSTGHRVIHHHHHHHRPMILVTVSLFIIPKCCWPLLYASRSRFLSNLFEKSSFVDHSVP